MTGSRAAIAALIVALGLAGCSSDDPEPKVAPSTPSSPSTTAVSEPEAPTMPEAAKGTDAAAAEAFVEFYWDLVDEAQRTGEVDALRAVSENCPTCDGGIESIESIYEGGGQVRGGGASLSDFETTFQQDDQVRAVVEFTLHNARQRVDYPGRAKDVTYPGGRLNYQTIVSHGSDGWRVLFLGER